MAVLYTEFYRTDVVGNSTAVRGSVYKILGRHNIVIYKGTVQNGHITIVINRTTPSISSIGRIIQNYGIVMSKSCMIDVGNNTDFRIGIQALTVINGTAVTLIVCFGSVVFKD